MGSTWELLLVSVPCVGELGQVRGPYKAGQVHQLPLLHGGIGPHLHSHSLGIEGGGGQGLTQGVGGLAGVDAFILQHCVVDLQAQRVGGCGHL